MSKIVKFTKDHVSGFSEGQVKELPDGLAVRLKSEGFVKDATKKELDDYIKTAVPNELPNSHKAIKAEVNATAKNCEECGGTINKDGECEGCDEEGGEEKKYHVLTQEDIDANKDEAEGLSVGDEVEENEEGDLLVVEGKFVKKPEGNE